MQSSRLFKCVFDSFKKSFYKSFDAIFGKYAVLRLLTLLYICQKVATKACGMFNEVKPRRPRLVLGWKTEHCEPVSVRWCGPLSVTDRLYSRHCADTDVK